MFLILATNAGIGAMGMTGTVQADKPQFCFDEKNNTEQGYSTICYETKGDCNKGLDNTGLTH